MMKRLAIILALCALPVAAQAANADYSKLRSCMEDNRIYEVCIMEIEPEATARESADVFMRGCTAGFNVLADDTESYRKYMRDCTVARIYIKKRWGT